MKSETPVPHVFVAGASRRVGFETAKAFRAKGFQAKDYEVTCFFRNTDHLGGVEATGARAVIVDAFDTAAVAAAVSDAGPLNALICSLGGKPAMNRGSTILVLKIALMRLRWPASVASSL